MLIGINAVAAFKKPRTGVEEYTYQLIKHLTKLKQTEKHSFVLYNQNNQEFDFELPFNFKIKKLKWGLPMWTQARLALEMQVKKPEILFIPVHVLPLIHPENSVVTLHGLEYEYYPEMYPKKHLKYLRLATKYALKNARKIIAVSENTKKDLINIYNGDPRKIQVVYHGVGQDFKLKKQTNSDPYILFIGRLETKKNIHGLIRAFCLLKDRYKVPHKLVLVGPPGYGYNSLACRLGTGDSIIEKGYVTEKQKWNLLAQADLFILPSFYEGFCMPILEAQKVGCPVITSNLSSMPEVIGDSAVLINPFDIEQITQAMHKIIKDQEFRNNLINKGYKNLERFSWQKCAQETLGVLTSL